MSLNFARGGASSNGEIDAVWENQNETIYNRFQLQDVSGVGDKASWSNLGGGQLRAASKGQIFYVSLSVMVMSGEDKPLDAQDMIDKASIMAKQLIERM